MIAKGMMRMKNLTSVNSCNKIFCLIGPSGTGKSTIAKLIDLPKVVSYRTREIREGEIDGVDGYFISKEQFLKMDQQGLWIAKTDYAGNYYGITQGEILELEDSPMLYVIDWEGVLLLREQLEKMDGYSKDQLVTIFIHTPRYDLEARLKHAKRDPQEIKARLDRSDLDYASSHKCDYVVENHNGEIYKTIADIMNIILKESFNIGRK